MNWKKWTTEQLRERVANSGRRPPNFEEMARDQLIDFLDSRTMPLMCLYDPRISWKQEL